MLMQPLQIPAEFLKNGWWVPFDIYRYNYGESQEAVYSRRSKGIWKDGVHCKIIKGAGLWINLIAVNAWASTSKSRVKKESPKGSPSDAPPPASPKAFESLSSSAASSAAND